VRIVQELSKLAVAAWVTLLLVAGPAQAADCPNAGKVAVPGAEMQRLACLDDMTTTATAASDYTDAADWASLNPVGQRKPSGVPGLQVDGYFPDTSTANTTHGWLHDSQFVIRLPHEWNGRLILTGAPGTRKQYAHDVEISDWVLSRGYAYASTDKGNGGTSFYSDGIEPGDAGVEWNTRVTELAIATKQVVAQYYGKLADRTYVTGISQGGYLTRWQLENRPELYDGGVDWEGTFWNASTPNIFTNLVAGIRYFPEYRLTRSRAARDAMIKAGFAPGSEFLWDDHYVVYWDLTQRTYREEFDPSYDGALTGGIPFCQEGVPMCDADYDYASRPEAQAAVRRIENTGRIGKPMLTLHGTLDTLLPIATNGDPYTARVRAAGKGGLHRYYVIEDGNHVDGRYDLFPDKIRPIWPCWTKALEALEGWVERGQAPPPSQFVPDRGEAQDVLHQCTLEKGQDVPGPGPTATTAERAKARRLTLTVKRRGRTLRAAGRLVLPAGIHGCGSGTVAITIKSGRRTVTTRYARLAANCSYRMTIAYRRVPRRPLRANARFFGNRVVKGIKARYVQVR
jgi:hypothetical protein